MRFKIMKACLGLAIVLKASTLLAQNSLVDDFSGGTDENLFENYWYYYDDNGGTKAEDRPQNAPTSTPSIINVPYGTKHRHASNNPNDTFLLKEYRFLIKEEPGNKYGCMPFTYGDKWKPSYTAWPFVGIGTELAPDGKFIDLTGATEITFKLRSHVNDLTVNFRIETMDIIRDSSFAYFNSAIAVPKGAWKECSVLIPTDLIQPAWTSSEQKKASFLQTQAAKLAWEVHGEFNNSVTSDTLDVDDIVIKNFTFVSPTIWTKTALARPATGLFSNFDVTPRSSTPFSTFWYAYDDHDIAGNSLITQGAQIDTVSKSLGLDFQPGRGFCNAGYGPAIQMKIGKTIRKANGIGDTSNVRGFVGIGLCTYDSAGAVYFNSATGKMGNLPQSTTGGSANSLYFEYLADGDFKYLTLEVLDKNDVPDKSAIARKETRGSGIAWYRNFPMTGPNAWRRVEIPLDSLITHSTWKGYKDIPLDKANLAKIQFKVQGAENNAGVIQIDNVFFPGIDFGLKEGVKNALVRTGQQSAFRALYCNKMVRVEWQAVADFKRGKLSLIDLKGVTVKTISFTQASKRALDISAQRLIAGLYFVQLNGTDAADKVVQRRTTVTLLK
jgi:hypothetical protein